MWYATRGAGIATLVLLTGTVVLGVATSVRFESPRTPRFVTATLHRNLSLVAVLLLAVHIVTTVLDPYAGITARDAAIPFIASYRPIWLGLGVLAAQILVAVALTSLLRRSIGPRAWRLIHWTAYASWPLAVVHGLGTGSDAQAPWMLGLTGSCIAAVLGAIWRRVRTGRLATLPLRFVAGAVAVASTVAILAWAARGPLQPGWAVAAGTPAVQASGSPTPWAPVHTGSQAFSDSLIGTRATDAAGRTQIALRDVVDPGLTMAIRPPTSAETLPVLTVFRDGHTVCTAPASATASLYAVCGGTRLTISLYEDAVHLTGTLAASGPIGTPAG
jgi:methionine sulfoxide reductase heme-binding subunit